MTEILTSLSLFIVLFAGLGLPVTATLPLEPDERFCLGAAVGCVMVYLAAWIVYWCNLPAIAFWALPVAAVVMVSLRRRPLAVLFQDPGTRRLAGLWLLVAGWCLGLLALVRSYSGGEWVGDWIEHYERTLFFLQHQPLDTIFLRQQYTVPARPPLANLVTGAFMAMTSVNFIQFQIFSTLLASLAFLPAALLARHFRGPAAGDPAAALAVLLMLNPLFVQNATFTWTKLPAVFFVLAGLVFFVRAGRSPGGLRMMAAAFCLGAAVLTHYSAAPYLIILAAVWCWHRRADWKRADCWREAMRPAFVLTGLLATWFIWSDWHYGQATFLSNTTVTGSAGMSYAGKLHQMGTNFFRTLVPHPLRAADYSPVQQADMFSWVRDYCFNIYQTTLALACGSGGLVALCVLVWRKRHSLSAFWGGFVIAAVTLNIAVISWSDRWGVVHIGLQAVVLLALAWLAASLPKLGRLWQSVLAAGLILDGVLGIAIHYRVQNLAFPPDLFATHHDRVLGYVHGYATWVNFGSKCILHLTFLGDIAPPAWFVCGLLAGLLGITLSLALGKNKTASCK